MLGCSRFMLPSISVLVEHSPQLLALPYSQCRCAAVQLRETYKLQQWAGKRMPFDHAAITRTVSRLGPDQPTNTRNSACAATDWAGRTKHQDSVNAFDVHGYFAVLARRTSAVVPLTARGWAKGDTAGVMPCNSAPDAVNALRT